MKTIVDWIPENEVVMVLSYRNPQTERYCIVRVLTRSDGRFLCLKNYFHGKGTIIRDTFEEALEWANSEFLHLVNHYANDAP